MTQRKQGGELPKHQRRKKGILRQYPVRSNTFPDTSEHAESLELHPIGAELAKAKPRDSVLLPLMRREYFHFK